MKLSSAITAFILTAFCLLLAAVLLPARADALTADGKIVVALDPGHGGTSTGTCEGGEPEYVFNMAVALACRDALEADGRFTVVLSHTDNAVSLEHWQRMLAADGVNADCCISFHFNGNDETSLHGTETFVSVLDRFSLPGLAAGIQKNLTGRFGFKDLGVIARPDTGDETGVYYWNAAHQWDVPDDPSAGPLSDLYGMITMGCKFGVPTIIIEHCYLSNAGDRAVALQTGVLTAMGGADAEAIISFYTGHTHEWSAERVTDYPSNCLYRGKASYVCRTCLARRDTVTLPAAADGGHLWLEESRTPATCTKDGSVTYYCRIVHNFIVKNREDLTEEHRTEVLPATGHQYETILDTAVTHTEDGFKIIRCTRCLDTIQTVTKAEGHTFEILYETLPTCTEAGYIQRRCTVCGLEERMETAPATGHQHDLNEVVPPTCTEAGHETYICRYCGNAVTTVQPALGHDDTVLSERAPLCEKNGESIYSCSRCHRTRYEARQALGHLLEPLPETAPTCTVPGSRGTVCTRCLKEFPETIPPLGHSYKPGEGTAPTCTLPGANVSVCDRCGAVEREVLAPLGHDWALESVTPADGLFHGSVTCFRCQRDGSHTREEMGAAYIDDPSHLAFLCSLLALLLGAAILALLFGRRAKRRGQLRRMAADRAANRAAEDAAAEKTDTAAGRPVR